MLRKCRLGFACKHEGVGGDGCVGGDGGEGSADGVVEGTLDVFLLPGPPEELKLMKYGAKDMQVLISLWAAHTTMGKESSRTSKRQ